MQSKNDLLLNEKCKKILRGHIMFQSIMQVITEAFAASNTERVIVAYSYRPGTAPCIRLPAAVRSVSHGHTFWRGYY